MNIDTSKPLSAAEITFRKVVNNGTGRAVILPMVNGVDIPNVQSALVNQTLEGSMMILTVMLPRGVIVE